MLLGAVGEGRRLAILAEDSEAPVEMSSPELALTVVRQNSFLTQE
jgi:hypothetical protein